VRKLGREGVPLTRKQRTFQGSLDLSLPKSPEGSRNVAGPVKMVNIGDELQAVQSALSYFLAGQRKFLTRPAIGQPCFSGKESQKFFESLREFDEHLCVELPSLIDKSDADPDTADKKSPKLRQVEYLHARSPTEIAFPK
jgi:hypothetical protein